MAISVAVQKGPMVYAYNEKNQQSFSKSGELVGYTGSTVSVKNGNMVYTYNEKGQQISSHSSH
ncbi:MAG: hypothetical protein LBT55_00635 [Clostridiaceae bacterium]|jgi:hypothetical protein|nr:hypothetical protein [Clostridiaceae bacterium]